MKAAILILSVILSITVKVNGLQCYVCYDCAKPTDDYLLTCDDVASNSTTTTTSTTESATNSSSTTSTTTPSTTTPTTTTSSTTTENSTSPINSSSTIAPDTNATDTNATSEFEADMIYQSVERANSYECFSGTLNVSNTMVTIRGCSINPANTTCVAYGVSDCKTCSTDKCNGATALHSSAALLCLLFLTLLYKE